MFKHTLAAVFIHASLIYQAAGHGNIFDPNPEGASDAYRWYFGGPAGSIDMPELVGKATYGEYYKGVDKWFTANNVDSVKDFVETYIPDLPECGNTKKNGTPRQLPSDGYVKHNSLGNSHPGPCEVWCDDTRVFHDTNCAGKFAGQVPTKIPIDLKTCKSSSELVFYWLALHVQPWQVYINCVTLDGAGAPKSSSKNSTSTTSKKTAAPTYTFDETFDEGSVGNDADQDAAAETPVTTTAPETQAPPATAAPSTSSSKCLRRRA
ncbi:hypothetical protein F442_15611 [Phytophthora nicotianae P10297]|uniref:Pectate lyase n=1 Tax=Phytophthora nicotianae P10297 TaxID=1317064 RepID=W2YN34_PHYNI|nr:hypothetical protein F442_15611 [Phytophthora nicotianae P10297]